ncbi:hypothetical protein BDW59DRAFT_181471 [Aspergillus cavernicola]|uniref:Nucleoside phosphorylase domain-containing protein n=1 Tax=Aspergillus cavernicola TaxID=176166 RepID=A0ABR4IWR0_9EURO
MRPSSRDEFAVAIICALTLEAEAVEDLFDETYDRFGVFYKKQPGDDNAYINGRIGDHHAVLCYMPGMGKGNAASVASSLKISYKRIQVALVVGVCGGAPCPSAGGEIFLGDVIISNAVVEYDFGKQYPGGFERKTDIRSILAGLQAKRSRIDLQAKMLQHVQAIQESEPDWHRPTSADVLFEASYQHKHYDLTSSPMCVCLDTSDDICKAALDTACTRLGCDEDQICQRQRGTEHYSPRSEGVIGFEMEGAGVWDNISCIIIKGVCDYADSHKNKAWQAYAAATGAATAKAFLEYWGPTVREDLTAVPAIEEFIGREDNLNCLWDYLQPASSPTRRIAVLYGLGGIGKTQLAIYFARKHKSDFTAIFWLSSKDRSALVLSLSSCLPWILGQPVNINATKEEEAEKRASQVLQWLARPGNTGWLIIFDNIDQYSPLQNDNIHGYDICEFFPKADHGSIMITSRLQRLTELGKSFPVQKLMERDTIQLLLQSSGFSAQDITQADAKQDLTNLANQLDGLPLAIVIAGAFMRETGTSIKEYLQFYKNTWSDLQSQSEPTRHYQQGNILETWMITYHEIQKHDPTAAMLLLLLACFDNQDIWYELIKCGLNGSYTPHWFNMAVSNKLVFKSKIKTLIGFSLVEMKQQEGSYTIHPVVQDWCSHIAASENHIIQLYELALVSVGYMVPSNADRDYARLQQRLLSHANYLIQSEKYNWPDDRTDIWGALQGLGNLYSDQSMLKEAEELYHQALAGYEKALGPDHMSTLNTIHYLGGLYFNQGKLKESEEMYHQALAGKEKALGPDHTSTLDTVNNLGNVYSDQGKLKEAEVMYHQALAGYEKARGSGYTSYPPTLNTINNLGRLYKNQGKLKESEEMYHQALALKEKALGPDHTSTLNTIHNLGNVYSDQGKLKEAEEMYHQALAGYKKVVGPDHMSTLETVNNLGNLYRSQGKLKEAEGMYQQALAGYKKVVGPDNETYPPALNTVNNLGLLYKDQGKLKEAEKMYHQALAGKEKALGPDHISTLETVKNLGDFYQSQGKLKEAEEMYQQALAGYKKALGPDHSTTHTVANNLAPLASFSADRDTPYPIPLNRPAANALGANTLQSSLPESSRKRDILYRFVRRK